MGNGSAKKGTTSRSHVYVRRGVQTIDPAVAEAAAPVQIGSTDHFIVSYDSDLGDEGATLADAILAKCEADYATLQEYFGGITPPNLPFKILVTTDSTGAFHYSCAGTELFIGGRSASSANIDFILSLVVAEEDEVFEAASGLGWDCGASNGEGLSRVLANDMYPGAEPPNFVSAPVWLDEPGRPDWVTQTEPTDRNYVSIGCSVLFLNWLRFQLNYSWQKIIAAGAPSLGDVYETLTGKTDGFERFQAQLEANFPSGSPSGLTTDQPYPLSGLDGAVGVSGKKVGKIAGSGATTTNANTTVLKLDVSKMSVRALSGNLSSFFTRITPDASPGRGVLTISGLPAGTRVISVWMTEWVMGDRSHAGGAFYYTSSVQLFNNGTQCRVVYNLDWSDHLPSACQVIYGPG